MISKPTPSLIEQLEEHMNVDVDSLDPIFVQSLPIQPHDQTSNQRIVHEAIVNPAHQTDVEQIIRSAPGASWEEVYARCIARFAKRMSEIISGRVLSQTSPSHAYDVDYILKDARMRVKAYNDEGISNDRLCIKIAVTSAGIEAAKILKQEGIPTLGTGLSSVHQALAAAQAGMYAISNYFNEPTAHTDATVWPDVEDIATGHPMAARHLLMRYAYDELERRTGKKQPQMKTASVASAREVMMMVELGAEHVTIGRPLLDDLSQFSQLPRHQKGNWKVRIGDQSSRAGFAWEDWKAPSPNVMKGRIDELLKAAKEPLDLDRDYTAPGVVDAMNDEDSMTSSQIKEGLKRFSVWEDESRKEILRLQELYK